MALTPTTADSVLKEDYQPIVREQLNQKIPFLQQIEKNDKDFEGRRAVLALHVTRNAGIGARAAGGTLPTAGNQAYVEERVPVYRNYGRGQIDGSTIRHMKSDKGSFLRAIESETKGVTNDLKRDYNRQLFGDGTGAITGACALSSNSTLVTFGTTVTATQIRQLEVGMLVDIGTVAAPTAATSANAITAVNSATPSITVTTALTAATTHFVFRSGNGGALAGTTQREITGIQAIVSDAGTLFNVNPSTYPVWKSTVSSNSGTNRALSENLMATVVNNVEIANGEAPNLAVTSAGVFRSFAALQTSLKRFNDKVDLAGGWKGLTFSAGGSPVNLVWDRDAPENRIWFLNGSNLTHFVMSDWEFMEEDGAVLNRVTDLDAYEFVLFKYSELATDKRNAHGLLADITES